MNRELVKKAVQEAEESLEKKQIDEVKRIVVKTLEKIEKLSKEKDSLKTKEKDLEEKIRLLKMDIDDLKEGRLDRISERQEKDPEAKETSVVIIIKERVVERTYSPWYEPYRVIWRTNEPIFTSPTFYTTSGNSLSISNGDSSVTELGNEFSINNSVAKLSTVGCYTIGTKVVNLR